nr:immunoglobulin heavy chain junction region [Macaca mulatta]MOW20000.1 immunoglobulin heavy chain junction region [Macaca mulatta]MOW20995.1 immunoglobulin heavy chain junction region [Macaca mulatta]MOW21172.1 immunoglobulin heavy chain junction region [Macaca mulatta]MOW21943.1 immunoglobulin heavy chain junction region [Macaca mulatta]
CTRYCGGMYCYEGGALDSW